MCTLCQQDRSARAPPHEAVLLPAPAPAVHGHRLGSHQRKPFAVQPVAVAVVAAGAGGVTVLLNLVT